MRADMSERIRDERGKVLSGLGWRFAEKAMTESISFAISIVLARLLLPSDYGLVAIVTMLISVADVFLSSGFNVSLIQKRDADEMDFSTAFYANVALAAILYSGLYALSPMVSELYHIKELTPAIRVMGVSLLLASVDSVQNAHVARNLQFRRLFWSSLAGTVISAAVGIWMALHGYGVWALIAQRLLDQGIDALVLWVTVKWRPRLMFSLHRLSSMFVFSGRITFSSLLDIFFMRLQEFMISTAFSVVDLAFYQKSRQYAYRAVLDISSSIGSVLFPVMSGQQKNADRLRKMVRRSLQVSSYIIWPVMMFLCVIAEPMIRWMLTQRWMPCVPYFRIACFSLAFMPVHTANMQALKVLGRSDLYLRVEVIKKLCLLASLLVTIRFSPLAVASGLAFVSLLGTFINAFPNRKTLGYGYRAQMSDMLPSMLLAMGVAAAVWPLSRWIASDLLLIAAQGGAGLMLYLAASRILKLEGYQYCVKLLRGRLPRWPGRRVAA
jgi:O-antigen/teichoic acid export membrane protein